MSDGSGLRSSSESRHARGVVTPHDLDKVTYFATAFNSPPQASSLTSYPGLPGRPGGVASSHHSPHSYSSRHNYNRNNNNGNQLLVSAPSSGWVTPRGLLSPTYPTAVTPRVLEPLDVVVSKKSTHLRPSPSSEFSHGSDDSSSSVEASFSDTRHGVVLSPGVSGRRNDARISPSGLLLPQLPHSPDPRSLPTVKVPPPQPVSAFAFASPPSTLYTANSAASYPHGGAKPSKYLFSLSSASSQEGHTNDFVSVNSMYSPDIHTTPRPMRLPLISTNDDALSMAMMNRQLNLPDTSSAQSGGGGGGGEAADVSVPTAGASNVQRSLLNAVQTLEMHLKETTPVAWMQAKLSLSDAAAAPLSVSESKSELALCEEERKALLSMCTMIERRIADGSSGPQVPQSNHNNNNNNNNRPELVKALSLSETVSVPLTAKHSQSGFGECDAGLTSAASVSPATGHVTPSRNEFMSTEDTMITSPASVMPPMAATASNNNTTNNTTPSSDTLASSVASFGRGFSKGVTDAMASREHAAHRVYCAAGRTLMLLDSWQYITTHCYEAFADMLFAELLKANPPYSLLFVGKDIRHQALMVMDMLGRAVVAFVDPTEMMDLMGELGARHRLYGITVDHYKAMEKAFFLSLETLVPDESSRGETAWKGFWATTIELLGLGSRSLRGDHYDGLRKTQWINEVQKLFKAMRPLEEAGPESLRRHMFALTMYEIALEDRPELSAFSNMATVRTGDRLMNSVYYIVEHLTDENTSALEEYIKLISARHEEYGVDAKALQDFSPYYVETVQQFLKRLPEDAFAELWNAKTSRHLLSFWNFLIERWADGFAKKRERTALLQGLDLDGTHAITFIFTDIEKSTLLWEKNSDTMAAAVRQHHAVIRSLIADNAAFEVKTVGDSFMIACKNPAVALKIAIGIQLEFMRYPVTSGFSMCDGAVGTGEARCWREDSLRVRVGVHMGTQATPVYDAVHNRYDYYGPVVNCAARVEAAAAGGQILMTRECVTELVNTPEFNTYAVPWQLRTFENVDVTLDKGSSGRLRRRTTFNADRTMKDFVFFYEGGALELRGIAHPVEVVSVVPRELNGRSFPGQGRQLTIEELQAKSVDTAVEA